MPGCCFSLRAKVFPAEVVEVTNDNTLGTTTDTSGFQLLKTFKEKFGNLVLLCSALSCCSVPKGKTGQNFDDSDKYSSLIYQLQLNGGWSKEVPLEGTIGFYRPADNLGSGNFGNVRVAKHVLLQGGDVALKTIPKSQKSGAKVHTMVDREIEALETLQHPNIIRLFEVIETVTNYYLILECIGGGTLDDKLRNVGKYTEADAATVFAQMASAIGHMHRSLIVHRDLKAENILMHDELHVKICDFGFSKRLRTLFEMQHTHCGSLPYAAPELFGDKSYNGPQVDMWALGVLLFFMLEGELPFPSRVASELQKQISEGAYEMPENISSSCQNMITGLLETAALDRYTIEQVTLHSWLRNLSLPAPYPRFGITAQDLVGNDEQRAREIIRKIGVSDQMIEETAAQGAKHPITGLFRVVLHRIHSREADIERDLVMNGLNDPSMPRSENPNGDKQRIS